MSEECPDTGTCHHSCPEGEDGHRVPCFRVRHASPLTIHANQWSHAELTEHAPERVDQVFRLGARVRFTWTLTRGVDWDTPTSDSDRKVWRSKLWPTSPEPEAREGIIVGLRTLSDGVRTWNGYDIPVTYRPTRHFSAYLIAHSLRAKPVLVLPEHVEVLGG